jgi:hypothetical protein
MDEKNGAKNEKVWAINASLLSFRFNNHDSYLFILSFKHVNKSMFQNWDKGLSSLDQKSRWNAKIWAIFC